MNNITKLKMRVSDLGELNPMPDIKNVSYIHAGFEAKPSLSEEEKRYLGKGMVSTMLPYLLQDGYDRSKEEKDVNTVILENDCLKATFLPDYGARLWSLYDKRAERELLYVNTVIQPCNLGLRNAWLSGGVEFNLGIKGHTPLTCDSMFCDFIGDDAVRFYEYERIRGVAYSITAYLPKGSEALYIRTRVENTKDEDIFMYWWTNIALPETENTRVIVPTDDSIHCLYQEDRYVLGKQAIPYVDGTDVSYPLALKGSSDFFYKIPENQDKWEAMVDKNGYGFLEYSDRRLIGRKLFLWGKNPGGRHWSEWLSEEGQSYIEIQAGLAHTQLEHIPMPAKTKWEWTEAFTSLDGSKQELYGEWNGAIKAAEAQFDRKIQTGAVLPCASLDSIKIEGEVKNVYKGSGWGDLENKVRTTFGCEKISDRLDFYEVRNEETEIWYSLLEDGYLPYKPTCYVPKSYVAGALWEALLKQSLENKEAEHWFTYLQYGVCCYANGKLEEAMKLWQRSIELETSLWAYRNLGMAYTNEYKDAKTGLSYMKEALSQKGAKSCISLLKDYAFMAVNNGADRDFIELYESLEKEEKDNKRLMVYLALAYLNLGDYKKTMEIITPDFVLNDIKEGELSMSKIWFDMHALMLQKEKGLSESEAKACVEEEYPLPYALDFRMHERKKQNKK